jgi:hypothetical protein
MVDILWLSPKTSGSIPFMLTMILDRNAVDFKHFQKMVDGMMAASKDSPIRAYDGYRQLMRQTRSIRYHMSSGETVFIDSTHTLVAALEDYFDSRRVTPDTASDDAANTALSTIVFEIVYQALHKTTFSSSQTTSTTAAGANNDTVDIEDGHQAPKETNDTATCLDESNPAPRKKSYKGVACRQDLVDEEIEKAKLNTLSNTFNKAKYAVKNYKTVKALGLLATLYAVGHFAVQVGQNQWHASRAAAAS